MTPAEEARLATWIARPDWPTIRPLLQTVLGATLKPVDELVLKVRREQWGDRS